MTHQYMEIKIKELEKRIKALEQGSKLWHCKDCRWWRDSDGVYRRGFGAESQCPINNHAAYCGEGYCYMFEPFEPKTEKVIKMRDATPEERESVDKYIKSISKPTGVNFETLLEQEQITDRIEYETDGNAYRLTINNGKELEQEPCGDVISRILARMWNCRGKHTTSIDKVKMEQIIRDELSSVMQTSWKWIPVSEELPKEGKTVIASSEYGVYPEARYTKEDGWEWVFEHHVAGADYWEPLECVQAWMPLPKRYDPQRESEEE